MADSDAGMSVRNREDRYGRKSEKAEMSETRVHSRNDEAGFAEGALISTHCPAIAHLAICSSEDLAPNRLS